MTVRDVTTLELDDDHWDTEGAGTTTPRAEPKTPERPPLPSSKTVAKKAAIPAPPAPSRLAAEAVKGPRPAPPATPVTPAAAGSASPKLPVRSPIAKPGDGARPAVPVVAKAAPVAAAPVAAAPVAPAPVSAPRAPVVPPRAPITASARDATADAPAPAAAAAATATVPATRSAEAPRLDEKSDAAPPSEPSHVRGTLPRPESRGPGTPATLDQRDWLAHLVEAAAVEERRSQDRESEPHAAARADTSSATPRSVPATTSPTSPASSARESRAGLPSASARSMPIERGLCAFWVQNRCFALDVDLVGEVVNVESVVPVPMSHPAMMGLFNLRGTPVALVDLALALSLDQRAPAARPAITNVVALVFRSSRMVAAAIIDRMEAVLPAGSNLLTVPGATDSPLVKGFIEPRKKDGVTITVLDHPAVVERLERLKYA
jgi:chemotaxis signal transduction protein